MDKKIYKQIEPEVRSIDETTRTIWHKITAEVVDRMGDIVRIGGLDMDAFRKKPAVLYGHSYQGVDPVPVIGECLGLERRGRALWAGTQFLDPLQVSGKLGDLVKDLWVLNKKKLMGWSIGFIPLETEDLKDDAGAIVGKDFKRAELLEYSNVTIPANQEAVNDMVSKGIVSKAVNSFSQPAADDLSEVRKRLDVINAITREMQEKIKRFEKLSKERIGEAGKFYYRYVDPVDVDRFKRWAVQEILRFCQNHFENPKTLGVCDDVKVRWVKECWADYPGALEYEYEFLGLATYRDGLIDLRADKPFWMEKLTVCHEFFHIYAFRKRGGHGTAEDRRLEEIGAEGFAETISRELMDWRPNENRWANLG
jgi:hypothetical protein